VKRVGVTGMLVLGLATLAGSATATSLNHQLDQKLADRLTIHLTDLPTGWRVEPVSKSSSPPCKAIKSVKSVETARAETKFSNGPDVAGGTVAVLPTVAISKRTCHACFSGSKLKTTSYFLSGSRLRTSGMGMVVSKEPPLGYIRRRNSIVYSIVLSILISSLFKTLLLYLFFGNPEIPVYKKVYKT